MSFRTLIISVFCVLLLSLPGWTQSTENEGIRLYKEGKYADSARILSLALKDKFFKTDPVMWNYLGLALTKLDDFKGAAKAFAQAVELDPRSAPYHSNAAFAYLMLVKSSMARSEADKAIAIDPHNLNAYFVRARANLWSQKPELARGDVDRMIEIDPSFSQSYLLYVDILLTQLSDEFTRERRPSIRDHITYLKSAVDMLEKGVEETRGKTGADQVQAQLEAVRAFFEFYSKEPSNTADGTEPGTTPARVLEHPRAQYTESARQRGVSGTVTLSVLIGTDGQVKYILVLKRLGYGLDENAVSAARKLKFEPKLKYGQPVSTVKTIEYSFSVY
jgi:TonB family protein